jgi:hypothetical protein
VSPIAVTLDACVSIQYIGARRGADGSDACNDKHCLQAELVAHRRKALSVPRSSNKSYSSKVIRFGCMQKALHSVSGSTFTELRVVTLAVYWL